MKKNLYFIAIFLLGTFTLPAQPVSTNPLIPVDNEAVTVTFDATKGDQGLMNYAGDIYAHTGVITDKSTSGSDWKYVKADWNVNIAACKLTRVSTNTYQLQISPSIREFYGVPAGEKILKMAFVFRSPDGTKTGRDVGGKDIFADVFESGLNVSFASPVNRFSLVSANSTIDINVNASDNDSIALFLDNKLISSTTGQTLSYSIVATGNNKHMLVAEAYKGTNTVSDTAYYLSAGTPQNKTVPVGMKDGINYIDNNTVTFVLFAPYKKYIYLIGDFNDWTPDSSYLMNKDSSRYWITIGNLTPGKEYVFQYLIDGNLRIADPYSEKISDPNNDKDIPSRIYPNLIQYPYNKTTDIAGVIQTAQTPFNWQVTNFTPPSKEKLVVYELLIRDFTSNKDIKTVKDSLQYLKKLGVNAIELMPFNEFEGNNSWGYNPSFYFAPDKAYGTKNDYKQFIDACHQMGMAVIQDIVLDFSTGSSPLVRMYFSGTNPSSQNPWYNVNAPAGAYTFGGYDFNHDSPYTRNFTDSVTSFWMTQYKIDGFRFDFAKGWTNTPGEGTPYDQPRINNLELAASHIWSVNPNGLVILELFTANSEELVLSNYGMMIWGNMNYNYNQATMGYSSGWDFSSISYKNLGWKKPGLVGYMESHDEERLMYKNVTYGNSSGNYTVKDTATALRRMEMANTLFIPVPGPKMIWQFGELGYDVSINYNGRVGDKPVKWDYYKNPKRKHLYDVIGALIDLKKNEPLFSTTQFTMNTSGAVKQVRLDSSDNHAIMVGNFDVVNNNATISFPSSGWWYDFFSNDSINLSGTDYSLTLFPGEYHLYSNKKLTGFGSVITSVKNPVISDEIKVFPNPFSTEIKIENRGDFKSAELTDLQGRVLMFSSSGNLNTTRIKPGIYMLVVEKKNGSKYTVKIVKH